MIPYHFTDVMLSLTARVKSPGAEALFRVSPPPYIYRSRFGNSATDSFLFQMEPALLTDLSKLTADLYDLNI